MSSNLLREKILKATTAQEIENILEESNRVYEKESKEFTEN